MSKQAHAGGGDMQREAAGHPHDGDASEQRQSLWLLAAAPLIWTAHFLACYLTAAIWCAKVAGRTGELAEVRTWIAIYTAVALIGIAIVFVMGLRRHELGAAAVPHDFDTPEDRHRFLGFATVLLAGLSAVAVIYVALPALVMQTCR